MVILRAPEPIGPSNRYIHLIRHPDRAVRISIERCCNATGGVFLRKGVPGRVWCKALLIANPADRRARPLEDHGMGSVAMKDIGDRGCGRAVKPDFYHLAIFRQNLCEL